MKTLGPPSSLIHVNASVTGGECPWLCGLSSQRKHSFFGGEKCHSRGTCAESPGRVCFGAGSKDRREQSSVRAARLPPAFADLPQHPCAALNRGGPLPARLRRDVEKQLFRRCNRRYLSRFGLCHDIAANQRHRELVLPALQVGSLTAGGSACVETRADRGRYPSLPPLAVDGSIMFKFWFSSSGITQ